MNYTKKTIAAMLSLSMLTSGALALGANTAMADELNIDTTNSQIISVNNHRTALKGAGFTDEELDQFSESEIAELYHILISGEHALNDDFTQTTGVYSKLAQGILKIFKKLPASVQKAIGPVGDFLDYIDSFTGTTEHIIYSACKAIGMNDWWANFCTKTIMFFL